MAPRHYRNFDLVIEADDEDFRVRVSDSPAGEAEGTFATPFGPHELENFVLKMGARRGVRRMGSVPRTAAQVFGQRLYDAVFTSEVEYALRQSLQVCRDDGDGLRVRLRLAGAPALSDLPWEYLHSTALGRPLALSVDTPVVRYMDMGLPVEALEVAPPLRILMVAASPTDLDTLDTERELANLRTATADLVRQGRIEVHALARPTVADLQHQLRKGAFHILHFMGHGIFDEATGLGMLAFEDDDGRARPVAGVDLGMMLHDHRALQLVVLNACEGSRTSVQDPLGGVAQSLARHGVPAVIAMQFEISDGAAKRFSHELYLAIADGYPVDAAVSEARKALYLRDRTTEWGTPVLHMRAADGHIFDLSEPPRPAEVSVLRDEVDALAGGDATQEISAIGILQRILELDPDDAAAAERLARLQAAARRPVDDGAAADGSVPAAGAPPSGPGDGGGSGPSAGDAGDSGRPGGDVRSPTSAPRPSPGAPETARSPDRTGDARSDRRPPWQRRIAVGVMALAALLLVVGVLGDGGDDGRPGGTTPTLGPDGDEDARGDRPAAWMEGLPPGAMVAVSAVGDIEVDGVFDDWPGDVMLVPVDVVVQGDTAAMSAVATAVWDEDALFVAAVVEDPEVVQPWAGDPSQLWRGDSVSFEYARNPSDVVDDRVVPGDVRVMLGPDDGTHGVLAAINPEQDGELVPGGPVEDIEVGSRLTDVGYDLEASIPWHVLGERPEVGAVVGFNVNVSDWDAAAGRRRAMLTTTETRLGPFALHRPACWGRLLVWDDPADVPSDAQLPRLPDVGSC